MRKMYNNSLVSLSLEAVNIFKLHTYLGKFSQTKTGELMSACRMPSHHRCYFWKFTLQRDSVSDTPAHKNTPSAVKRHSCAVTPVSGDKPDSLISLLQSPVKLKPRPFQDLLTRGRERPLMVMSVKVLRFVFPTVLVPVAPLLGSPRSPCGLSHDDLHHTFIHTFTQRDRPSPAEPAAAFPLK